MLDACFGGVSARKEVHTPSGFRNIFAPTAGPYINECFPPVKPCIQPKTTFVSRYAQKNIITIIAIIAIMTFVIKP